MTETLRGYYDDQSQMMEDCNRRYEASCLNTIIQQNKDSKQTSILGSERGVHAENIEHVPGTKKETNKFLIRPVSNAQHWC